MSLAAKLWKDDKDKKAREAYENKAGKQRAYTSGCTNVGCMPVVEWPMGRVVCCGQLCLRRPLCHHQSNGKA